MNRMVFVLVIFWIAHNWTISGNWLNSAQYNSAKYNRLFVLATEFANSTQRWYSGIFQFIFMTTESVIAMWIIMQSNLLVFLPLSRTVKRTRGHIFKPSDDNRCGFEILSWPLLGTLGYIFSVNDDDDNDDDYYDDDNGVCNYNANTMMEDWRWLNVCCHHRQRRLDIPWWITIHDANNWGDDKNYAFEPILPKCISFILKIPS